MGDLGSEVSETADFALLSGNCEDFSFFFESDWKQLRKRLTCIVLLFNGIILVALLTIEQGDRSGCR